MSRQDVIDQAAKIAEVLRQRREAGEYPLPASRLRELADLAISDDELFKALGHDSLAVAARKDLSAPVALVEDAAAFAAGDPLLLYALNKLATAEKPLHPIAKLVGKVEKSLQPAFEASLNERLAANTLPTGVGRQDAKEMPHLFLTQFPPPPPKRFPAKELAEQLVAAFAERQEQGESVVRLEDLCPADTPGNVLKKAVEEEIFATKLAVLPVSKTLTFATPRGELSSLLTGDQLLTALIEARTTGKKPTLALTDLAAAVPEQHREVFTATLNERMEGNRLPAGVMVRQEEAGPALCLTKNLPIALLLGEKVLTALKRRRDAGQDYPTRLDLLVQAEAPDTPAEQLEQLASDKTFRGQIVAAVAGRADAPVALPGDEERLATSTLCLQYAVEQLSTREQPLQPLKKIVARLEAAVRPAFEQAVTNHVEQNTLPSTLAAHDVKGTPHLRRADYPLPPPADEALANKLVLALRSARQGGTYPLGFRALWQQADASASEKLARTAMGHDAFRHHALVAMPGDLDSLVAMSDDRVRLLEEPRMLEAVLTRSRSDDNQAIAVADLGRFLAAELRTEFLEAVIDQVTTGKQPSSIGCVMMKKRPFVFFRRDLETPVKIAPVEEVPVRESFTGEMTRLETGRESREPTDEAPVEQGDLFAPAETE